MPPPAHDPPDDDGIAINAESLQTLKTYFDDAEAAGKGGLAEDEFVSLLADVLKKRNVSARQELTHLFMKIDANSDGSVDWDEFTNYLLMESQSSDVLEQHHHELVPCRIPEPGDNHQHYHRDMIEQIVYLAKSEKYLTCSRDATLKVWNCKDLSHHRTIRSDGGWIVGACLLDRSQRIASCNLDLTVNFYDANTFEIVSRFNDDPRTRHHDLTAAQFRRGVRHPHPRTRLRHTPVSVCSIPTTGAYDQMAVGDAAGAVTVIEFADKWHACDGSLAGCSHEAGKYHGVRQTYLGAVHADWVTDLKFLPEFDALVSASLDRTVQFLDLDRPADPVRKRYGGHTRGVTSFDYCAAYKLMVSCGSSRRISVWDPYRCREVTTLSGHGAAVQQVVCNDASNQIVSLAADKTVKIWDCRTYRCVQTLPDARHHRPEDRLSQIAYVRPQGALLVASNHLQAYQTETQLATGTPTSHDDEICAAIYNAGFRQVVSGDRHGLVKVWDLLTGHLVSSFRPGHGRGRITSMIFDASMRRLITAADDGSIRIWNFSSGACLSTCHAPPPDDAAGRRRAGPVRREITCLGFIVDERVPDHSLRLLLSSGWDGNLQIWLDGGAAQVGRDALIQPGPGRRAHTDDVSCMAICSCALVATGSYDGSVVVWNLDTRQVKKRVDPLPDAAGAGASIDALVWVAELGHLIACGSTGTVQALDLGAGWARAWAWTGRGRAYLCGTGRGLDLALGLASGHVHLYRAGTGGLRLQRAWRAHDRALISIDAVDPQRGPAAGQADRPLLLVTGSLDRRVLLWASTGALIGQFTSAATGPAWDLDDPGTWASPAPDLVVVDDEPGPGTAPASPPSGPVPAAAAAAATDATDANADLAQALQQEVEDDYWTSLTAIRSGRGPHQTLSRAGTSATKAEARTATVSAGSPAPAKSAATLATIQYRIHSRLALAEVDDVPML